MTEAWRLSYEPLLPLHKPPVDVGHYDPYPAFSLGAGKLRVGFMALAKALAPHRVILMDGEVGVFWEEMHQQLDAAFRQLGLRVRWLPAQASLRPPAEIERMLMPFIGNDDPVFGRLFDGQLRAFFDLSKWADLRPDPFADLTIVYGCGAALAPHEGFTVWVEVPKNEVQARARAGQVIPLGAERPLPFKATYKRLYFVDWVALRCHKRWLLPRIGLFVDAQRPDTPVFIDGKDWRAAMKALGSSVFRPRPWFLPGPWGGQWMKRHILPPAFDAPNYAWSYELIAPENGILLESDGVLLEFSMDWLMFLSAADILGDGAEVFGDYFPIRFDYLDTYDGGHLSIQCHPRLRYAREQFGEQWTQDEAYYIVDCRPDAFVYLGFRGDANLSEFRAALERSSQFGEPVAIDRYVQRFPTHRHAFFLIPSGTIHAAGKGNLVLEISATPYLYTFKLYDWLRPDLDGGFRPLHLDRAFSNLVAERRGERVRQELICRPLVMRTGDGWQLEHLRTHPEHFYDVFRLTISSQAPVPFAPSCLVGNLVEGESLLVETAGGFRYRVNFAETFIVPATAQPIRARNEGNRPAKLVWAQLKGSVAVTQR